MPERKRRSFFNPEAIMPNIYDEYNILDKQGIIKARRLDGLQVVEILVMWKDADGKIRPETSQMSWVNL
jgi:hypothetical protein